MLNPWLSAVVLAIAGNLVLFAGEGSTPDALDRLQAKEGILGGGPARRAAFAEILECRKRVVTRLIEIVGKKDLQDTGEWSSFYLAIVLLGEWRAPEAVEVLSRNLVYYQNTGGFFTTDTRCESPYPAAVALSKIGLPAIQAMDSLVSESADPETRKVAAWTLMKIEGKDQAINRLESKIIRCGDKDLGQKRRLKSAADYIKNYEPEFKLWPPR